VFLDNQKNPRHRAFVRHEHSQRKASPLVMEALRAACALAWIVASAARLAYAEPAPASALQKYLWDERALQGSDADKTALTTRHGICPAGQPDCRQVPELTGETGALLPEAPALPGSIRSVVPRDGQKLMALTFDLCEMAGERAGYDANIVNYLRQHGIKATFYAGGKWMRSHPEKTLQLLADPLFEIGNHGWRHRNMRHLKAVEAEQEVLWTQAQYVSLRKELEEKARSSGLPMPAVAAVPGSFRFPYGTCTAENQRMLEKLKLPAVQWSIVTGDPSRGRGAAAMASAVLSQAKPGAIVVAHANGKGWHTAEALPLFIPPLQQQGYRFVTVAELLRSAGQVETSNLCYELKPGDNARYDRMGR
jgi:peptidoglycan/xylan/chitin deacetylase (PgdA/CDA1 family)